jgi:adenylyltransferase/sulfurtransferase
LTRTANHTIIANDHSSFFGSTITKMVNAIDALRQQIASCETTLHDLRQQLAEAEHTQRQQEKVLRQKPALSQDPLDHDMNFGVPDDFRSEVFAVLEQEHAARETGEGTSHERRWPLDKHEYKRYGRQLIMPEIGLHGQHYL